MTAMNISPLNKAYIDEKNFALSLLSWSTGPMPPKIIDAFKSASIQGNPAIQWYPAMPMNSATMIIICEWPIGV